MSYLCLQERKEKSSLTEKFDAETLKLSREHDSKLQEMKREFGRKKARLTEDQADEVSAAYQRVNRSQTGRMSA